MALELPYDDIHIYFAFTNEINDESLLSEYENLLTAKEKKQWQRFYFARHRHQYLITRALIRTTLSQYIDIDPRDWRFTPNKYGKPEIVQKPEDLQIRFNISHTEGLVMCGVTLGNDIGVDVEDKGRKSELLKIADRYFSNQEISDLYQAPKNKRQYRFFEYWTLKESYIKARGMGLSLPLDQFTFHIGDSQVVQISFDPRLEDEPNLWRFWRLKPSRNHLAAIAIKSEKKSCFNILTNKVIPLKSKISLALPPF